MEQQLWQSVIMQAPFGYAYHQVLTAQNGEPEDYVFLEVNPEFEAMVGLSAAEIIGKRVTSLTSAIPSGGFDWPQFYGQVALTGKRQQLVERCGLPQRPCRVTGFSPEAGYYVTLFQDVSEEMRQIKDLESQKTQIEELSRDLDKVFNGTNDAMFLVRLDEDGEFRCLRVNAAYERLVGYRPEQIIGLTAVEVMGETMGRAVNANYRRCAEEKRSITFEEDLAFPAGERYWLTTLTPVLENGQVKYLVGSRQDITRRRQAEEEQQRLAERLQTMFTEHTAAMLMIDPTSGQIVDANPAACQFYGYSREEILARSIREINLLSGTEVDLRMGETVRDGKGHFLFPHRLKSGEIRMVDVYSCPLTDGDGPLLFSIIFDATERERYRLSLQQEKEQLRTTLYSIGDGVVTTDATGQISSLNKAAEEISGWTQREARGRQFGEVFRLVNDETEQPIPDPVSNVLRSGRIQGLANHAALVRKDGSRVSLADSAAPIRDERGQTLGVVMVFRDVTAEKVHQQRILELSYYDQLTGLHNRRFMEEQLGELDTPSNWPLAVIMGDLNGLKLTNDIFGHEAGDRLLQLAALEIKQSCPENSVVIRWGGDEFVLLLPKTDAARAEAVLQRIKERCSIAREIELQLSIALGSAIKTTSEDDIWQLLKEAEERMYRQKLLEGKSYRNAILNILQATLLAKSHETEAHAMRLKEYSLQVGKAMGLPDKSLDELSLLAVLHDIGKVGVREDILQKPGPLTPAEWTEMKRHPEIGYRIAQNTPELSIVSEYILCHHERWDGSGYPRGLRGEEIPLLSRILAVVDAYDAMVSKRAYREAASRAEALAELERNAGRQFDPEVVTVFLANCPE